MTTTTFRQLLQQSLKSEDTEEWLDVYFTRPIGLVMALVCRSLHISPNAITIFSIFLGMGAGWMFYHEGMAYTIAGIALLMSANFCDSADGQLARLTGQKTFVGRVLDGFAGDVWFVSIYIGICLRLMPQHIPFTTMEWGWKIWVLAAVAGLLCHTRQAAAADYYRQIHLLMLKGRNGSELDTFRSQRDIYEQLHASHAPLLQQAFYYNYANYCHGQEKRTPEFQHFASVAILHHGSLDRIPEDMKEEFLSHSRPLMPMANILSFNVRAIALYISVLASIPWAYFVFEITVLTPLYFYMRHRHESLSHRLASTIEKDGDKVGKSDNESFLTPFLILDYGATIDTDGDHWSEIIWDEVKKELPEIEKDDFRKAYVYAERELGKGEIIKADTSFLDTLKAKINLETDYLTENGIVSLDDSAREDFCRNIVERLYRRTTLHIAHNREVLANLKKKHSLALVSNFYGNIHTVLKEMEIEEMFCDVVESAEEKIRKPDPRLLTLTIERIGAKAEQCIMVGDSLKKDIAPAKSLGCKTIWMKGRQWEEETLNDGNAPDRTITTLDELLSI